MDETFRRKILQLLDQHRTMRIATLRPDGWPQVTTVGYANDGLAIYFLCGADSQKAANLARDDRVSLAVDDDPAQVWTSPAYRWQHARSSWRIPANSKKPCGS
jgi:nitroimidazol reductase NimA-like FMN-containing flavoprotein (pyridoxamine 5'-phosphate oxidase superfamily)